MTGNRGLPTRHVDTKGEELTVRERAEQRAGSDQLQVRGNRRFYQTGYAKLARHLTRQLIPRAPAGIHTVVSAVRRLPIDERLGRTNNVQHVAGRHSSIDERANAGPGK